MDINGRTTERITVVQKLLDELLDDESSMKHYLRRDVKLLTTIKLMTEKESKQEIAYLQKCITETTQNVNKNYVFVRWVHNLQHHINLIEWTMNPEANIEMDEQFLEINWDTVIPKLHSAVETLTKLRDDGDIGFCHAVNVNLTTVIDNLSKRIKQLKGENDAY